MAMAARYRMLFVYIALLLCTSYISTAENSVEIDPETAEMQQISEVSCSGLLVQSAAVERQTVGA